MAKKRVQKMSKEFRDFVRKARADGKMLYVTTGGDIGVAERKNARKGRR